jgi:hypothetical protein
VIFSTEEQDRIGAQWARAFMRATGVTEVRIPMEELASSVGEVRWLDDPMTDERVFRLSVPAEVIDGEEVPPALVLASGEPHRYSGSAHRREIGA